MKVLVIGSGGREHAIVWKLKQSKKIKQIYCAPGNGGMSRAVKCINIKPDNTKALANFASRNKIGLTVVGPEQPLAKGIVDEFQRRKLRIFGPEKRAAMLESSKVFAKEFMQKYHIPTAPFKTFDNITDAVSFCKVIEYPAVVKVDGLAAGKGVIVVDDFDSACETVESIFDGKRFGDAGARIVIESFLTGQEVSVMAITDGRTVVPMMPSQDHKQAYEGDKGPNTGGMGAYCPATILTEELAAQVQQYILSPTIAGLRQENINYRGVLYAGLMLTEQGPKVLEFNCRFGDPETQVVLPMLKSDLLEIMQAVVDKRLDKAKQFEWHKGAAACVIMASQGYPGKYTSGHRISGLQHLKNEGGYVFHAGTRREQNHLVTAGGRVLGVMGRDNTLDGALKKAYQVVDQIKFEGATYRRDIGFRVLDSQK